MRVASHRLIDAAGKLEPGDRALLSLLINHGLDEEALARAIHTDGSQLSARRRQLAARLGTVLELEPRYVEEELEELTNSARAGRVNGTPDENSVGPENAHQTAPLTDTATVPSTDTATATSTATARSTATVTDRPAPPGESTIRSRRWAWSALLVAVVVVAVVVIALSAGGSSHHGATGTAATGTAATSTAATGTGTESASATRTAATSAASAGVRDRAELSSLPGGTPGAGGAIALTGPAAAPNLAITVTRLPSAGSGHYEVWLYNSVIDSRALAALGTTGGSAKVALPAGYRHYRWLDVALQPAGSTVHSGLSVLRTAMPATP